MLDHAELQALVPCYALEALDAAERREFETHLVSCEVCPPMVREFRSAAQLLAESAPEQEPPPAQRSRVLAVIQEEATGVPPLPAGESRPAMSPLPLGERVRVRGDVPPSGTVGPWWSFLFRRPARAGAVAVAVLAVAGLGYWNNQLQNDINTLQGRLDRAWAAAELMARAESWWRTGGSELAPQSTASLAYSTQDKRGCLMVWDLPAPAGKTYVAWTYKDNQPTRIGRLLPFDNYYWRFIDGDVRTVDSVQVTLEDNEQATTPSGPPVQLVSLRR